MTQDQRFPLPFGQLAQAATNELRTIGASMRLLRRVRVGNFGGRIQR